MSYPLDFSIRERLASYVANETSLREFEDWFFPETWDADQLDNMALTNLVYGIKLRLAEFSHGDWTEKELRTLLRTFVERYEIIAFPIKIQYGTSSTNVQIPSTTCH